MCDNELSAQSSYYILYKNESQNTSLVSPYSSITPQIQRIEPQIQIKKGRQVEDTSTSQDRDFWEDFEWTEEDKLSNKKALDQNLAKCDLVENLPPGRGQFLIRKFEEQADSYWNKFYSSHQTNFFKDRHYLHKTFPDEFGTVYGIHCLEDSGGGIDAEFDVNCFVSSASTDGTDFTIVEIGCGVGNTVLPLLELKSTLVLPSIEVRNTGPNVTGRTKRLVVWGLDFSETAVDLLRQDDRFIKAQQDSRARAAVWDITKTHPKDAPHELEASADISLLLFCLSAISPENMAIAARNVAATLKPGGMLLLRDYGRYDEAQLKLGKSRAKRLGENFYAKHDGTRCYYFELEDLKALFGNGDKGAGLEVVELKYIQRMYTNRSKEFVRRRVWVQGRFRKSIV